MSLYLVMGPFSFAGGSQLTFTDEGDAADTLRFCGSPGTFTTIQIVFCETIITLNSLPSSSLQEKMNDSQTTTNLYQP